MAELNYLAIVAAVVAAFVASSVWYVVFDIQRSDIQGEQATAATPAWKYPVELMRSLVVATVLAWLAARLDIVDWSGALQLGFALWIAFPVVLLAGSVIWEGAAWKVAAIHAGDWLVKTLMIAVIVVV